MKIFGTFGTRGIVNEKMSSDFALKIGLSFGSLLKEESESGKVLVGRDTRTSGQMLRNALVSGLQSTGYDVIDVGVVPTPAIQLGCRRDDDVVGGVIITASHNPPEYNGIKLLESNGMGLKKEREAQVEEIFASEDFYEADYTEIGESEQKKVLSNYKEEIKSNLEVEDIREADISIVVDPGNGSGSFGTSYLLRELGCEVKTLNSQPDGFFPGRDPEPTKKNLKDLRKLVPALGADLGVAHDGDADRAVFVDENGNFIEGDKTFGLIVDDMIGEDETVVTTVATSNLIDDLAKRNNGNVVKTEVGDLIVARKLHEIDGKVGGEENGGVIFPEMALGRDGAYTAAKIIEILSKKSESLSGLVENLPDYSQFKSKVECPDDKKSEVMDKTKNEIKKRIDADFDETDGLKAIVEDGWMIVRPSGTEPVVRCFSEAKKEERAEELLEIGLNSIKSSLEN